MDKADVTKADVFSTSYKENSKGLIVATLGKACKDPETLIKMLDAGVDSSNASAQAFLNIFRLRLCQEKRKKQVILLEYLKQAFTHKPHRKCSLMVDIRGRDICIGSFENDEAYVDLDAGEDLELFIDVEGDIKSSKQRLVSI